MQGILPEISRRERVVARLRWYAMISRYFRLGRTPREMSQMEWWSILSLRLVYEADVADHVTPAEVERAQNEDYLG